MRSVQSVFVTGLRGLSRLLCALRLLALCLLCAVLRLAALSVRAAVAGVVPAEGETRH